MYARIWYPIRIGLTHINPALAAQARVVLDINKAERHIRGGLATKEKYEHRLQACSRENR